MNIWSIDSEGRNTDYGLPSLENVHEVFFADVFSLMPARVSDHQPIIAVHM
jgi:hypothetical protein